MEKNAFYKSAPLIFLNGEGIRNLPSQSELTLWNYLKDSPQGYQFSRKHVIQDYIADFICIRLWLVIEILAGNHEKPELSDKDRQREDWLKERGFSILRFTHFEIERGFERVILTIENKVQLIGSALS